MARATMTLQGLYNYDHTILNVVKLPSRTSQEPMVAAILLECGDLEVLYPDAEFMKEAVRLWSRANEERWEKLANTQHFEYNPINNYDRTEEWEEEGENRGSHFTTTDGTSKGKSAGFNSEELVTSNGSEAHNTSRDETEGKSGNHKRGRAYGNIGVTTTQELIEAERKVLEFSIYDKIAQEFKQRFCIMVY